MLDLAIVNGTLASESGRVQADIGIVDGRIAQLAASGTLAEARKTIDATGMLVLPGVIDSHFHCRAPANPERETFATGTRAAAAGGVTTVIEMPISIPATTDGPSLRARRDVAEPELYVDMAFYSSSATLDRDRIQSAFNEGAVAYKAFLQDVPVGREAEFTGLCIYRNHDILRAIELVGETGRPAVFHAEDYDTLSYIGSRLESSGRNDIAAHWEWRPSYVEAITVNTLCLMAEATGIHVHLPHISAALSVEAIRAAKDRGAPVTAETCPQYLLFDQDTLRQHGPFAKCNPPFKTKADNEALWEGLRDGTIDTVATDHSPFTIEEKEAGFDNIWLAPPGLPGVEILTQSMLTAGLNGRLPLERAIQVMTSNPARIFGLSPAKGHLNPGSDADVTIYDPSQEVTIDTSTWESRSRGIGRAWHGMQVTGRVATTILRGTVIYDGQSIVGEPGYGQFLRTAAKARQDVSVS